MTEHGKKTGQEVESNAQKILEAIIYLRDNRLGNEKDPSAMAPSPQDDHDKMDTPWSIDLAEKDATLDDSPAVNLDISDELDTDLDKADSLVSQEPEANAAEPETEPATEDEDLWADALAEQANADTQSEAPSEPTAEQAEPDSEEDPWAAALAEQAATEASSEAPAADTEEEDPWAAALAEQEQAEKK